MPKIGERDLPVSTRRRVQEFRQAAYLPSALSWGPEVTITENVSVWESEGTGNKKLPCVSFEIDGLHWQYLNVPRYVDGERFLVHWEILVDEETGDVAATARPLVMPLSKPGMPSARAVNESAMGCYTVNIGQIDPRELKSALAAR